jgi:hypothetical protein
MQLTGNYLNPTANTERSKLLENANKRLKAQLRLLSTKSAAISRLRKSNKLLRRQTQNQLRGLKSISRIAHGGTREGIQERHLRKRAPPADSSSSDSDSVDSALEEVESTTSDNCEDEDSCADHESMVNL